MVRYCDNVLGDVDADIFAGKLLDEPFVLFLVQISVITMLCQGLGKLFKKIKLPMVIAEMVRGIMPPN